MRRDRRAMLQARKDAVELIDQQHHVRRLRRGGGAARAHGHADIGGGQRGRVVHAVADHHHRPVLALGEHHHDLLIGREVGAHCDRGRGPPLSPRPPHGGRRSRARSARCRARAGPAGSDPCPGRSASARISSPASPPSTPTATGERAGIGAARPLGGMPEPAPRRSRDRPRPRCGRRPCPRRPRRRSRSPGWAPRAPARAPAPRRRGSGRSCASTPGRARRRAAARPRREPGRRVGSPTSRGRPSVSVPVLSSTSDAIPGPSSPAPCRP